MTAISWCPGAPRARPRGRTSPASTRRPRGCAGIPARRPGKNVGLRAGSTLAPDRARSATLGGQMFNKITYDADVVLRAPRHAGEGTVIPYVVAGAGGITIHPIGSGSSWTKAAGNAGAGLEYRFARWGLRAEARDYLYQFDRYGYRQTQNPVAWQGGLTLSF